MLNSTFNPGVIPWYVSDLVLPFLVTFLTYLTTSVFFTPISKWRGLKDEMITLLVQYANYIAYSYIGKDGERHLEDRGLINKVEQDLRRLAGQVCTLSDYGFYWFWSFLKLLPNKDKIEAIRGDLIGWANSLVEKDMKHDSNREVRIESLRKNIDLPNNYMKLKAIQEHEWGTARKRS